MFEYHVDIYNTLICAAVVLFLGQFLTKRVTLFNQLTLPSPVVGGLLVAIILLFIKLLFNLTIIFDNSISDTFMWMFFASIGLNANLKQLFAGGKTLGLFLIAVVGLLFLQNIIGIGMATAMGENPLLGLLIGSVTLAGGHGTGKAWADTFIHNYGYSNALEIAMASATFGLILGGLIGGPVAKFLIKKKDFRTSADPLASADHLSAFEEPKIRRAIDAPVMIETIGMLAVCLSVGSAISTLLKGSFLELPAFVCVLFVGVILNNIIAVIPGYNIFERAVSIVGNTCLAIFLAMALMSMKLWELTELALPMLAILFVQTIVMAFYAIFITFRIMGKNYDAAVLAAGHCGFGLGATPTAIATMQAVTDRYGPSPIAFIIVPMVGAFFIDIINAITIKVCLLFPMFSSLLIV